jgi:hypothetical protein
MDMICLKCQNEWEAIVERPRCCPACKSVRWDRPLRFIVDRPESNPGRIGLTKGQVAIVDLWRYDELMQWKWTAHWEKCTKSFYAKRGSSIDGRSITIWMHRQILGLPYGDTRKVDHRNGNSLDMQEHNLRIATHQQNQQNNGRPTSSSSGFRGVYTRPDGKYFASIRINSKLVYLGSSHDPEMLAELRRNKAKELYGEFYREV